MATTWHSADGKGRVEWTRPLDAVQVYATIVGWDGNIMCIRTDDGEDMAIENGDKKFEFVGFEGIGGFIHPPKSP